MEKQDTGLLQATASLNPFGVDKTYIEFDHGKTLQDILDRFVEEYQKDHGVDVRRYNPVIFIDDHYIYPEFYSHVRPKAGHIITVNVAPHGGGGGGGKNPLKTIASIAISIAAGPIAGAILGPGIIASSALGATLITAGLKFAISAVGGLLINAIAPPAKPRLPSFQDTRGAGSTAEQSQTYFIQGARNRLSPFSTVPELLGTHRFTPPLAAQNFTEVSGQNVFARQMFILTNGKLSVSEEKLGDTLLSNYSDVSEENFYDGNSTDDSNIIPSIVTQTDLNITLSTGAGFTTQTTAINTDEIEVQITFPQGLIYFNDEGDEAEPVVDYTIRYAPTGTTDWVTSTFRERRTQRSAFIVAHRFSGLTRGQYDVQVSKDAVFTGSNPYDAMTWTALRSYKNENPVNVDGVSLKAIRIRGSEQLNGAIDDYNAVGSRKIPDWNGSSWVADQITSNPASILRHILTSDKAKTPISTSNIDNAALTDWHDYCETQGFEYNAYIDYDADREDLIREVCAAGLAVPVIVDNKYSVVVDKEKTTYVQHISQRNSFNFKYEKVFRKLPHALRVPFLNRNKDYLQDEIIVYDDGYDSSNATEFDQLDFPGVVEADHIYKLARHRLAEMRLRPDMYTVTMDIENLVATKGDLVKFSHDVALVGLGTGRIKTVNTSGSNITSLVLDEPVTMEAGNNYALEIRTSDGSMEVVNINTVAGVQTTVTPAATLATSTGIAAGDLFSFGIRESVTIDALIHSILPQPDFTAEIKLVDYNEGIYDAYDGVIPEYDNNITLPPEFTKPQAPVLVAVQSNEEVQIRNIDGSISSRLVITLQNNNSVSVEPIVTIKTSGATQFEPANTVQKDASRVVIEGLQQGSAYDIRVRYRRIGGAELSSNVISDPLAINDYIFIGEGSPPPDVNNFNITVRGETAYLEWDRVNVIDLSKYEIRYSPVVSGANWSGSIPLATNIPKEATSASFPNAIGTFLIKAVDRQGNYSENETLVTTTVGKLLGLNLVTTINEHTSWGGTFSGTADVGGNLELSGSDTIDDWTLIDDIETWDYGESGIASGGNYVFADTQDLGAVYDSVLNATLSVSGKNVFDEIDEWDDIDSRASWDGTDPSQYSVVLEVRTTNDNPAGSPTWSAWKPLKPLGEYTARAFQFRLVLSSFISDITPSVSQATVTIDMPDRVEADDDIASGAGGYSVTFTEAFRIAPVIEVTADNLNTGDYYTITNKTASGFDIEFFNSSDVSVDRTFSWVAQGYGRTP